MERTLPQLLSEIVGHIPPGFRDDLLAQLNHMIAVAETYEMPRDAWQEADTLIRPLLDESWAGPIQEMWITGPPSGLEQSIRMDDIHEIIRSASIVRELEAQVTDEP